MRLPPWNDPSRGAAIAEVASHAAESPQMVPLVAGLDRWAESLLAGEVRPNEAIDALPEDECTRLIETFVKLFPGEVAKALERHDELEVFSAVLVGAILCALGDRDASVLTDATAAAIENRKLTDPVEALAFALEGRRLWSEDDGRLADDELAAIPDSLDDEAAEARVDEVLAEVTSLLYGEWHARRMHWLVNQVRGQLPLEGHPQVSELLAEGCERFAADPGLGRLIATRLLVDVLPLEPPAFDEGLLERWAA